MITFISCAKTMSPSVKVDVPYQTVPEFAVEAERNAMELAGCSMQELKQMLKISDKLVAENARRYHDFLSEGNVPHAALLSYTGVVFKHINPADFTTEDWDYAQSHLFITSFLYGLLRPLDAIRNYRLEGNVRLECNGGLTMFDFWKPLLTDFLIDCVRRDDNVLVNLASAEMKNLFDWKRVCESVEVVTPDFAVNKGDSTKTVVIYAKMCRGEMLRYIVKNRITDPMQLRDFKWNGFSFSGEAGGDGNLLFTV